MEVSAHEFTDFLLRGLGCMQLRSKIVPLSLLLPAVSSYVLCSAYLAVAAVLLSGLIPMAFGQPTDHELSSGYVAL